jgi:hypothetical protein
MRSDLIITQKFAVLIFIAYICCVHYLVHMQRNYKSASGESSFISSKELSDGQLSMEASLFNNMETKDIDGYPNYYVTSDGKVFSTCDMHIGRTKELKPWTCRGYLSVVLYNNGMKKSILVHRLVAGAFIPNPLKLPVINHKDGNKKNNYYWNLEWCTSSENTRHAFKIGTMMALRGEDHYSHLLTEEQVLQIRLLHTPKRGSCIKLAEMFNVKRTTISNIIFRRTWKHI